MDKIGGIIIVLVLAVIVLLLFLGYRVGTLKLPGDIEIVFTPPAQQYRGGMPNDESLPIEGPQSEEVPVVPVIPSARSSMIVFERIQADTDGNGRINFDDNRALLLTDINGSGTIPLTDGTSNARDASWSPDGNSIVFASDAGGDFDIYIMNASGGPWQKIVDYPASDRGPSWSPDGQWIAFYSDRDGNKEIYRMRPNGSEVERLTLNTVEDEYPTWSTDGQWIAYQSGQCPTQDCRIYVMNFYGQDQRVLVNRNSYWPSWSSDGRFIGYSTVTEGSQANIFTMELNSGVETRLTSVNSTGQSWSPDSGQIAHVRWGKDGPEIWIMKSDGSEPRQLTSGGWSTRPVWSP